MKQEKASAAFGAVRLGSVCISNTTTQAQAERLADAYNRLAAGDENERKLVEAWIYPQYVPTKRG